MEILQFWHLFEYMVKAKSDTFGSLKIFEQVTCIQCLEGGSFAPLPPPPPHI